MDLRIRAFFISEKEKQMKEKKKPCGTVPRKRKWVAVGYRVIIQPEPIEQVTESGIVIVPDSHVDLHQSACQVGTVISVGPDAWVRDGMEPWAESGNIVQYTRHGGSQLMDSQEPGSDQPSLIAVNDIDIHAVESAEGE